MENVRDICIRIMQMSSDTVGNLRLQKLLYFVQVYCLIEYSEQAFKEKIEAWTYGPVVPEAYFSYKRNLIDKNILVELDPRVEKAVKDVVNIFSDWSDFELVDLTHEYELWKKKSKEIFTSKEMSPSEILEFHDRRFKETGRVF